MKIKLENVYSECIFNLNQTIENPTRFVIFCLMNVLLFTVNRLTKPQKLSMREGGLILTVQSTLFLFILILKKFTASSCIFIYKILFAR